MFVHSWISSTSLFNFVQILEMWRARGARRSSECFDAYYRVVPSSVSAALIEGIVYLSAYERSTSPWTTCGRVLQHS